MTISTADKQNLFSTLATMLKAGISISEATESMAAEAKGAAKIFLEKAIKDLTQGKRLSETLAAFPSSFDPSTISVVKAAEESGKLETVLNDVSIHFKKQTEFAEKVRSATLYPLIVIGVFISVMLVILAVVMPRVSMVFTRLQIELPLMTRVMIFLSDILLQHTLLVGLILGGIIASLVSLYVWKKKAFISFMYHIPGLWGFGRDVDLALFCRSLALLLSAGISITDAIEMSQKSVFMRDVDKAISLVLRQIKNGKTLAEGLKQFPLIFPELMRRVIEAGEKSGTLEAATQNAAEYFELKMERSVKTFTTLLEPVLLVVIAVFIGGMMLAILAPIYGLIGQLGNR
jgi:type IV pilus assembly protein PilC